MPSLDSTSTRCHRCLQARHQGMMGCSNCLNQTQLKDSFYDVDTASREPASHIQAAVLLAVLKEYAGNTHARSSALEAVKKPASAIASSRELRNPAVRLIKRNTDKGTPAIWLHPAEGTSPTVHYYCWCALGRPTPRENKLYVDMNNIQKPRHIRGQHCKQCMEDRRLNASLHLAVEDPSKLVVEEKEKETWAGKKTGKHKRLNMKKTLGNLRESFRSQSPASATSHDELAAPLPKPGQRQEKKAKRIWRP